MKKVLLYGGLGILVIIILVAIFGGSSDKNGQQVTQPNQNQEQQKSVYAVGETVILKNHQLIANSVTTPWISSNMFDKPQSSENEYVMVNVTIINNGKSQLSVNSFGFKLEDENGVQRNASITVANNQLSTTELSVEGKVSGNLVFEAKTGSKTLKLHYSPGFLGGKEVVVNLK